MLATLVESRRSRDRSVGGTAVSVVVHAVLIGVITAVSVRANPAPTRDAEVIDTIYFPQAEPDSPEQPSGAERPVTKPTEPAAELPDVDVPDEILPGIPAEIATPVPIEAITFGGSARDGDPGDRGTGDPGSSGDGQAFFEWMVDVPAAGRRGNPAPIYPRALRESNVEGTVLAQFVIGIDGRADMRTFRALTASHALFEAAVRDAVSRMRFTPAESGGRKVRVLVQQSFAFKLEQGRE